MPRIVYGSDLHARPAHYCGLFDVARAEKADLVVLGGDLLPDDHDGLRLARTQSDWVEQRFAPLLTAHRTAGGAPVAAIPGNHDTVLGFAALAAAGVHAIHAAPLELSGWLLVGCGCTPPTPYHVKDFERRESSPAFSEPQPSRGYVSDTTTMSEVRPSELFASRATVREELDRLPHRERRTVLVCHCPPWDTSLDLMYGPRHIGSRDVRDHILARQPALALHGHIHESPELTGSCTHRLGATACYNAGQRNRMLSLLVVDLPAADGAEPRVDPRVVVLA